MKASDLFVTTLINRWVKVIYWVPWEENLDLVDSIRKSWKIELIVTRNEQTAVFMAATYWRLTWEIGVALATLWPWATNMVTWVAFAQLWWFPIMVITGQKPIKKSKQWFFQIIDVVSMMRPIVKCSKSIIWPERIPFILNNAIDLATSERPWAVAIELPEDIAAEHASADWINFVTNKVRRPVIDEKSIKILVWELEKAKSPIILIWAGANRKRITKYLSLFIEKYNIPFFNSQMWKWVVDESMNQYLWTAAVSDGDYIHDAIKKSDLIISVWYDPVEKPTHLIWAWLIKTIHVNFYETNSDSTYSPYLEIVWDIGNTFWQLYEAQIKQDWDFEDIYKIRNDYSKVINKNIEDEDMWNNILWPRKLVQDVRSVMSKSDIVALDNWLYKVWFARNYTTYEPNTLLLDNALATMWAWVASWMEAKRINPDKQVVVVTWDGWLVMNLWDLETVVRLWLDLTVVVLNNGSYWMIKWKQVWWNMPMWWMDFGNPDFVKMAESFWGIWYRVENKNDFKKTLENANKQKWLKIIDVLFDYPKDIN